MMLFIRTRIPFSSSTEFNARVLESEGVIICARAHVVRMDGRMIEGQALVLES